MREERRLSGFENRLLRRIYGPKREEVTGELRKLHNEELINLFTNSYSGDQLEKNETGGACSPYGGKKRHKIEGFGEGNKPLGRPRRRWEDNIKMDLNEVGYGV
jgi:hypothetical protein